MVPNAGLIYAGTAGTLAVYNSAVGPASFGPGGFSAATTGVNDLVGVIGGNGQILVPQGYLSGTPLSSTATWNGATIAGLGLTPGTYTWTWASDTFRVIIGAAAPASGIPTLSEWGLILMASIMAMFGIAYTRRMR
ncbi:MAG: IPTL-CTERM sorting domain-containing protein [Comamonadaceae bacterium]|nr:MAG: IPTL-CTERM sorting domain-containing protein [Comamonadaceae bacterium]